jgi:hypothetical protein
MPMKLGKKMVEARTVVTIAVYIVFLFGVLGRDNPGVRAMPKLVGVVRYVAVMPGMRS